MNKICTSLEQSKKLIELGIDINTADMYWDYDYDIQKYENCPILMDEQFDDVCTPAWSLSALSNFILPSIMDDNGNVYKFYLSKDGLNRWIAYYKSDNVSIHICEESYELLDVIFEMVCYIFKNED